MGLLTDDDSDETEHHQPESLKELAETDPVKAQELYDWLRSKEFNDLIEEIDAASEEEKQQLEIDLAARIVLQNRRVQRRAAALEAEESFKRELELDPTPTSINLNDLIEHPPEGDVDRVWSDVLDDHLMKFGQIGSLAGPDKAGKTRIAVSLARALLDPSGLTKFLGFYQVAPLKITESVLLIALEEDKNDVYAAWEPYFRDDPDLRGRVVIKSYTGKTADLMSESIRDLIFDEIGAEYKQREIDLGMDPRTLKIGMVILDPLFAMTRGDFSKDVNLATDVYNDILVSWCQKKLKADIVLVLAHTSKEGGRSGGVGGGAIYGSIGWASKMHFLWHVTKPMDGSDDYRLFGAARGRRNTYGSEQQLHLLHEGDAFGSPPSKWNQVEIDITMMGEAAAEKAGRSPGRDTSPEQRRKNTDEAIEAHIRKETARHEAGETTVLPTITSVVEHLTALGDPYTREGKKSPYNESQPYVSKTIGRLKRENVIETSKDSTNTRLKWVPAVASKALPTVEEAAGSEGGEPIGSLGTEVPEGD